MAKSRNLMVAIAALVGLAIGFAVALRDGDRDSPAPRADQSGRATGDSVGNRQTATGSTPIPRPRIRSWRSVEGFEKDVAVFESVFWDSRDTISLRKLIRDVLPLQGKSVLEIGTGSGLISLCCLKAGAQFVVATDVNRAAVANAIYNAEHLRVADRLDVRLVPLENASAFAVIKPDERFDVIVSNPPWVNQQPQTIEQYALYDAGFALMRTLIGGLREHLKPGGRVFLAYGCVDAIETLRRLAEEHGCELIIHDDRRLDDLPNEFLPGMLVEIRPSTK